MNNVKGAIITVRYWLPRLYETGEVDRNRYDNDVDYIKDLVYTDEILSLASTKEIIDVEIT